MKKLLGILLFIVCGFLMLCTMIIIFMPIIKRDYFHGAPDGADDIPYIAGEVIGYLALITIGTLFSMYTIRLGKKLYNS